MDENEISKIIVNCCMKIHKAVGPGLLESAYEEIFLYELVRNGLRCENQVPISFAYDSLLLLRGFRADVIVNGLVIVELKSVEILLPVHRKQLLTYLKLTELKLGLLINFNVPLMKNGIVRIVNNL